MSSHPPESDPRPEQPESDQRREPPELLDSDRTTTVDPSTLRFQGVPAQEQPEVSDGGRLSAEDQATIEALRPGTALLVVLRGPNSGARFLLDDSEVVAGRHPDSDIFLDDVTVSRKHAVFVKGDSGYAVRDAGSLNGTYVNRHLVDDSALHTGDEVQVGKFRLVYYAAA
ncbi:MAG: FHA domain-containing protein [Terracoccus sp.]